MGRISWTKMAAGYKTKVQEVLLKYKCPVCFSWLGITDCNGKIAHRYQSNQINHNIKTNNRWPNNINCSFSVMLHNSDTRDAWALLGVFCDFKYPLRRRFKQTTLTDSNAMTVDRMPGVAQSSSYPRHSRGRFTPKRLYHISQAGSDKCLWKKH